jgi:phosphoglycerate dehydrogenase-like enzyme
VLINVGRGPVVDDDALIDALQSGRIAGAGLDVFGEEPLPADHPLWTAPNTIISPHMAGDFVGWRRRLAELFADNFQRWIKGDSLRNVVDKQRAFAATKG